MNQALPITAVSVDGTRLDALVDTGCSVSIAHVSCCKSWRRQDVRIVTMGERVHRCEGTGVVCLKLSGGATVNIDVYVVSSKTLGFSFILGMNAIVALGGVTVRRGRDVAFGVESAPVCAAASATPTIDERDFSVTHDTLSNVWVASWKWTEGAEPELLKNQVNEYSVSREVRTLYEDELRTWIQAGWLIPYDEQRYGPAKGLIPLMAVVQQNKAKVRPVMDFRELNTHISAFTAESDVCAAKMREWRSQGTNVAIVDLMKAYLQIHIHESLWPYQTVVFQGQKYCLTRLGFGLNVAPLVMKAVLAHILSQDQDVRQGTSAYVDDIFVNEDIVPASRVVKHLNNYGLQCKAPESIVDGARVLGLRVWGERGKLLWRRDNDLEEVPNKLTRRVVFSYCGKIIGHYPVCGWLRVAVAFMKRRANYITQSWDEVIEDDELQACLRETVSEMRKNDPVRGRWDVKGDAAKVWVDASSLALGVVIEVNGQVIEDGSWLRKDDSGHINMAELDSVVKGLNLVLAWKIKSIELLTDSSTVHRWLSDGLTGKSRLKTKAASEMLIRRRIGVVMSLVEEYKLDLRVTLISSGNNKADALTRVPRRWLSRFQTGPTLSPPLCAVAGEMTAEELVKEVHHSCGHPGVRRTLYFAKRRDPQVTRRLVQDTVGNCQVCKSIDPAPTKWKEGHLEVDGIWQRVGMDVTHYENRHYLTLVDCGPSRFSVWRSLRLQTTACITEQLETIFCERGAPEELLMDNDNAFRSRSFAEFTKRWDVRLRFRGAHVPSGNGIVERCHRTVKVIAARKRCTVAEAVYLYNLTPRDDCSSSTAPANSLYRYAVRVRGEGSSESVEAEVDNPYYAGDDVWVRPPGVRCDGRYHKGVVTRVTSDQVVEVNGMPRHIKHLRPRLSSCSRDEACRKEEEEEDNDDDDEQLLITFPQEQDREPDVADADADEPGLRRSERIRRQRVCTMCD